jgi:thioredoxin reductase
VNDTISKELVMYDVIIIGGSYAGLAAALQLGRARRDVLVIDGGQRRNRYVSRAHGILGHDGVSPAAIAAKGKAAVLAYPSIRWRDASVTAARAVAGGFAVSAADAEHTARRLILATGVVDNLPAIPGLRERWGRTVFVCPYCDGYELDRGRLGVLAAGPVALHYASIVNEWGKPGETVLFLNGGIAPEPAELAELQSRGIRVEAGPVLEAKDASTGIELVVQGGPRRELAAVFAAQNTRLPGDFASQLGCEVELGVTGTIYKTDPRTKETTTTGVYACGDVALAQNSVTFAIADGARAGISVHQSLVFAHAVTAAHNHSAPSPLPRS